MCLIFEYGSVGALSGQAERSWASVRASRGRWMQEGVIRDPNGSFDMRSDAEKPTEALMSKLPFPIPNHSPLTFPAD